MAKAKQIKIKYRNPDTMRLDFVGGSERSNWIDLAADEEVIMARGEYRLIDLGVAMELPDGYEAHIVPRSSIYKNFKIILANSYGVIDSSYRGDADWWKFPAIALEATIIKRGSRICQFRIFKKQPHIEFLEVSQLNNADRGGIGSTGVSAPLPPPPIVITQELEDKYKYLLKDEPDDDGEDL